jgi:hypothetical protein
MNKTKDLYHSIALIQHLFALPQSATDPRCKVFVCIFLHSDCEFELLSFELFHLNRRTTQFVKSVKSEERFKDSFTFE